MCTVVMPFWVATLTAPASRRARPVRELLRIGWSRVGTELGGCALPDDPTGMHDRYPVGQLLGLLEVVGCQEHRPTPIPQGCDKVPDPAPALGVEAGGRLVE